MTDLSKAFGKGGMEGMQPGWDASLKRVSYGHEVLTAAAAPKGCDKAWPLRVKVHPGLPTSGAMYSATAAPSTRRWQDLWPLA